MARVTYVGTRQIYLPRHYRALSQNDSLEVPEEEVESFTRRGDFVLENEAKPELEGRPKRVAREKQEVAEATVTDDTGESTTDE